MEQIIGYIERITFQNPDNGYTVAQLKEPHRRELTCVVGLMPTVRAGETVRCRGQWKNHLVHGRQFEVEEHTVEAPAEILGIKKYLASGLIRGIGPVYAERIVERFGEDTLGVIDVNTNLLLEIPGIGKKRIETIRQCWEEQKAIREVMLFLQQYGVSPVYAQKIFKTYGAESIQKVTENPFHLARDIFGIGFKTADTIAQEMGIDKTAAQRIDAGIEFVLSELSNEGNVCYPLMEFLPAAQVILEVDAVQIAERLEVLEGEKRIVLRDLLVDNEMTRCLWLKALYLCEEGITRQLRRLQATLCRLRDVNVDRAVAWVQETLRLRLAPKQAAAVAMALQEKVQIITGGPGTGKSTITNAILTITSKLTDKILLAAPTGRAAKRMTEITRRKALTIHSLLEYSFATGAFKRNRQAPLDCDLIIIDEASMIDTQLMYSLLKALPDQARVVFVGDINQLPSVGPGNVLRDLIKSNTVPVTMLNEIFRQARGSRIVTNAHRINNGTFPQIDTDPSSDFFFMEAEDPEQVLATIVGLVTHRLPKRYGYNSLDDIQVLAPMKRGIVGTHNLNTVLQQKLNADKEPLIRAGIRFQVGDKVMQRRNNYQKEVYNGDVGRIKKIDNIDQKMIVIVDGRNITYDFSDLDELQLAYAVSIHKYQGSECTCVVMPIHTTHFKLLHRNLLYTGVTRGRKLVVLVGTKKALAIAVKNDEVRRRYTGLQQALTAER